MRTDKTILGAHLLGIGLCVLAAAPGRSAEEPSSEVLQMIVDLVKEQDRDMRALAYEQIRDEARGEAATKKFASLLTEVPAEVQAELLKALGERGDAAARPAVLEMLNSKDEPVRAAAIGALEILGTAAEVPLLAEKAATGPQSERVAARHALEHLRGAGINQALVALLDKANPAVQAEVLGALGGRSARETVPKVLQSAKAEDRSVRLAALRAMRVLAEAKDTAAVAGLVRSAADPQERAVAELALLALCSRGREACVEALCAAMADASPDAQVTLVRAVARAGGERALQAIAEQVAKGRDPVRLEAVRMLSSWPQANAIPQLLSLAEKATSQRDKVLALRGLVRLASPQEDRPADVALLAKVMNWADRPEEKRLVLGALGTAATAEAFSLAAAALAEPNVAEEASLAVVAIAEKMPGADKGPLRAAMEKVLQTSKDEELRARAKRLLGP